MLARAALVKALRAMKGDPRPENGIWIRAIAHEYLSGPPPGAPAGSGPQPLWSYGAPTYGARYTAKGGVPMLYLAQDYGVALKEVGAMIEVAGRLVPAMPKPMTTVQVSVRLNNVLDLCEAAGRTALGTSLQELTGNWRLDDSPPTQVLGAVLAKDARYDGLIAPSAQSPSRAVLVVFPNRLSRKKGTFCQVLGGGGLGQRVPP